MTDLPWDFDEPVGAVVSSSHIWLAGRRANPYASYLVNVDDWEFRRMPDMAEERSYLSCGMVENPVGLLAAYFGGTCWHLPFSLL